MLRALKTYWAFTKLGYRLMVFILMPAVLLLLNGFCVYTEIPVMVSLLIGYSYLVPIDIITDYWFLGGFYAKNNSSLEYLQSSNRFREIIRDVVLVDILRRVLLYIGMYLLVMVMGLQDSEQMEWYAACSFLPLLCFVISQFGVLIGRHYVAWNQVYAVAAVAMVIEGISLTILMWLTSKNLWLVQGVLLVLAVAVSVMVVAYSKKKVRASYYDK